MGDVAGCSGREAHRCLFRDRGGDGASCRGGARFEGIVGSRRVDRAQRGRGSSLSRDSACVPGRPGRGWFSPCVVEGDPTRQAQRDCRRLAESGRRAAHSELEDDPQDLLRLGDGGVPDRHRMRGSGSGRDAAARAAGDGAAQEGERRPAGGAVAWQPRRTSGRVSGGDPARVAEACASYSPGSRAVRDGLRGRRLRELWRGEQRGGRHGPAAEEVQGSRWSQAARQQELRDVGRCTLDVSGEGRSTRRAGALLPARPRPSAGPRFTAAWRPIAERQPEIHEQGQVEISLRVSPLGTS